VNYWPNNFKKLTLTNINTGAVRFTCLTEMIEDFGYQVCAEVFRGTSRDFIVKGRRK